MWHKRVTCVYTDFILDKDSLVKFGHLVEGSPEVSSLYTEIENNEMPPGEALSQNDKILINNWITALGGLTERIVYEDVYDQIIENQCLSCHSGATPAGDIPLTTQEELTATVWVGFPEGSLIYDSVVQERMPKDPDPKLTEEQIELLYNWIKGGAL